MKELSGVGKMRSLSCLVGWVPGNINLSNSLNLGLGRCAVGKSKDVSSNPQPPHTQSGVAVRARSSSTGVETEGSRE